MMHIEQTMEEKNPEELGSSETNLEMTFSRFKKLYSEAPYPGIESRKEILLTLKKSIIENEKVLYDAFVKDFGYRSEFDSLVADILPSVVGINYTLKNLKKWMKPSKRHAGLLLMPSTVAVHYQPLGVVGVIVPWNFPAFLCLSPAVQALAAGNRVMIKMSEFTPAINQVMIRIFHSISDHVVIVEGESDVGAAFSALPFDHLIFTGSTTVGRYVAQAAAKNLTPTTLELGGKSPVIITEDANWEAAIDSIIFGKILNAGQTCVAPDYVFVPRASEQRFIQLFKERFLRYFDNTKNKNTSTHVINKKQFNRLQGLITDAKDKGATIHAIQQKQADSDNTLLYPHILTNVSTSMEVMQTEIFGLVFPVLPYDTVDECITYINEQPRPLALYIMSSNKETINKILKNTHSGGVCVNETVMHVAADDVPFGGIGDSGMGHYHGEEGFRTFSKAKTVLASKTWLPRNKYLLTYRDLAVKVLRLLFLR